jgi:7,8-dihydroneopterin aldolase/epimerase/oxygenase
MDETAIAFEQPHARAAATHAGPPLDRISVRDYTRSVEIGAFRSERGVTQRIRFNVVLEVSHHAAARDDDVDQIISYDTITEAIEHELAAERVNLLETLAERVAGRVLADPRAVRVFVRLEKLDRIPGALGVEIVRSRVPDAAPRLRPVDSEPAAEPARIRVVFLPAELATGPQADRWRDALAGWDHPLVVCLAPLAPQPAPASEAQQRIGLLAIEQAAWAFCDADRRFAVVGSRTELEWAARTGRRSVWAPSRLVTAALHGPVPDAGAPAELAAWLAGELGAAMLVIAGAPAIESTVPVRSARSPEELTAL